MSALLLAVHMEITIMNSNMYSNGCISYIDAHSAYDEECERKHVCCFALLLSLSGPVCGNVTKFPRELI